MEMMAFAAWIHEQFDSFRCGIFPVRVLRRFPRKGQRRSSRDGAFRIISSASPMRQRQLLIRGREFWRIDKLLTPEKPPANLRRLPRYVVWPLADSFPRLPPRAWAAVTIWFGVASARAHSALITTSVALRGDRHALRASARLRFCIPAFGRLTCSLRGVPHDRRYLVPSRQRFVQNAPCRSCRLSRTVQFSRWVLRRTRKFASKRSEVEEAGKLPRLNRRTFLRLRRAFRDFFTEGRG